MRKYYITFFFFSFLFSTYAQTSGENNSSPESELFEDQNLSDMVSLYPNPAKEFLHVRAANIKVTKVEIFSLLGDKVKEIEFNFNNIYLGDLLRGIYMVKIFVKDRYTVKKLIVK